MRPNRQLPEGLPDNAGWTALDSLSIDPILTASSIVLPLASPLYEANASHLYL